MKNNSQTYWKATENLVPRKTQICCKIAFNPFYWHFDYGIFKNKKQNAKAALCSRHEYRSSNKD